MSSKLGTMEAKSSYGTGEVEKPCSSKSRHGAEKVLLYCLLEMDRANREEQYCRTYLLSQHPIEFFGIMYKPLAI